MMRITTCSKASAFNAIRTINPSVVLSILDPGEKLDLPNGRYRHFRIDMHDITEGLAGYVAPDQAKVAAILALAGMLDDDDIVLVHCSAGLSRSTAAAIAMRTSRLAWQSVSPAVNSASIAAEVADFFKRTPDATPNPAIIRIADAQMRLDGALIRAVARARGDGLILHAGSIL